MPRLVALTGFFHWGTFMRSSLISRALAAVLSVAVLTTGLVASVPGQASAFSPAIAVTADPAPDQTASSDGSMIKPDLSGIVTEEAASADPIIPVAPAPVRILNEDGSVGLAPEPQPQGNDTEPKASPRKAAAMKKVQESPEDPQAAQEAAAASADPEPKVDLPAGVYDANAPDYDSSVRTDLSPKSPADRATKQGLTPTLIAEITNPQPSTSYKFRYSVCEQRAIGYFVSPCPDDKAVADSGWITAGSWTVPPSKLKADSTYFWMVQGQGGSGWSIGYGTAYFATGDKLDTGLPAVAKGVAPAIGVTVSTTIPSLESRVEDGVAGVSYEFNFQVEQGDKAIWNSGWLKDSKTTVSEKQLYWNANYTWSTAIRKSGTTDASIYYASGSFQVAVPEQNGSAAWASEGTSQTVRGGQSRLGRIFDGVDGRDLETRGCFLRYRAGLSQR